MSIKNSINQLTVINNHCRNIRASISSMVQTKSGEEKSEN